MPLPSPSGKEKRSKFISRCVSDLTKRGEGKDAAQRVAICNSRFKSKSAQVKLTLEEIKAIDLIMGTEKKKKKKKKDDGVVY